MSDSERCTQCGSTARVLKKKGPHTGEYCAECEKWIQWIQGSWEDFKWPIGPQKYTGQTLKYILDHDRGFVEWGAQTLKGSLKRRCEQALASLTPRGNNVVYPNDRQARDHLSRRVLSCTPKILTNPDTIGIIQSITTYQ